MKKTIVTGVTGQIGSVMVDYLLENTDHQIIGTIRRLSVNNHKNIEHVHNPRFALAQMDLSDSHSITALIEKEKPDYFINLAANSFVGSSWTYPVQHMEINAIGVLHQLEAIRKYSPHTRYLNLGSSEEFGDVRESPQTEKTELRPRSPYGASKVAARMLVKVYRESYNLYALQPWNFNTEGPRRGEEFVTRKITMGVARIKRALESGESFDPIELGSLDTKRDWQAAEDVCDGIWRMLNQEKYNTAMPVQFPRINQTIVGELRALTKEEKTLKIPQELVIPHLKEYILASGETHSIREFCDAAFAAAEIGGCRWLEDKNPKEIALWHDPSDNCLVEVNPKFYRPADVEHLCGNASAARQELGWNPKISFEELVRRMVENDLKIAKNQVK